MRRIAAALPGTRCGNTTLRPRRNKRRFRCGAACAQFYSAAVARALGIIAQRRRRTASAQGGHMSLSRTEILLLAICLAAALGGAVGVRGAVAPADPPQLSAAPRAAAWSRTITAWRSPIPTAGWRIWTRRRPAPGCRPRRRSAASYLDALSRARAPRRRASRRCTTSRGSASRFSEQGRYFYTSNSGRQEQSVLLSTTELAAAPRWPSTRTRLPPQRHPVVVGYVASRDGTAPRVRRVGRGL